MISEKHFEKDMKKCLSCTIRGDCPCQLLAFYVFFDCRGSATEALRNLRKSANKDIRPEVRKAFKHYIEISECDD